MDRDYDVITFVLKYFVLRKARVVNFADISQFVTMVIRTNCKD